MAFDTPRTTEIADLPCRTDHKRSRTLLIDVASATGALGLRHRVIEPLTGTPELRVWDPARGGPTVVVRADTEVDPGRRGDGLELLVGVEAKQDEAAWCGPPSFVRLEDDEAGGAARQIAQMLEEAR